MRRLLGDLFEDLKRLEIRIKDVTREIEALAAKDDRARRLMTVPGPVSLVRSPSLVLKVPRLTWSNIRTRDQGPRLKDQVRCATSR